VDELLQKHRTFTLAVAVGGFVFLVALLLRGCAVYDRDLGQARASVENKAKELTGSPVPDEKYLKAMEGVVAAADARVEALSNEVGRTATGERLWEECIADVLAVIGQDRPEKRKDLMDKARRLPSAALSLLVEDCRTCFAARAAENDVEIAAQDLGFDQVTEAGFARQLAALAAAVRVVDRAIALGVDRIENIAVGGVQNAAAAEGASFLQSVTLRFKIRGAPADLAELVKSLNDRDGKGRRLVLDEIYALGRPEGIKAAEAGVAEFSIRVFLVDLAAREEE
jgi:hypothetical protein